MEHFRPDALAASPIQAPKPGVPKYVSVVFLSGYFCVTVWDARGTFAEASREYRVLVQTNIATLESGTAGWPMLKAHARPDQKFVH